MIFMQRLFLSLMVIRWLLRYLEIEQMWAAGIKPSSHVEELLSSQIPKPPPKIYQISPVYKSRQKISFLAQTIQADNTFNFKK